MKKLVLALFVASLLGCRPAQQPVAAPVHIDAPVEAVAPPKIATPPPVVPVAAPKAKIVPPVEPVAEPITAVAPKSKPVSIVLPEPVAAPVVEKPVLVTPEKRPAFVVDKEDAPVMTPSGLGLVLEYEVGGERQYRRWPHPEYSGGASGVTWGIGYDGHQNTRAAIMSDWEDLGIKPVTRLAATQPYFGASAKARYKDVVDITVPWELSVEVFLEIDVSRTDTQCKRGFPGFDSLRPHAKDAIRSLVFNRGAAMSGPNRVEMRWMRDKGVPNKDYAGLAQAERDMKRIWRGTSIQDGMYRRREAEAKLFETP